MVRTRQILAVVVVATALGADRLAAATPIRSPQITQTVRQLADRFTCGFQETLPNVRPQQTRQPAAAPTPQHFVPAAQPVPIHHAEITPFQFRLPPPRIC